MLKIKSYYRALSITKKVSFFLMISAFACIFLSSILNYFQTISGLEKSLGENLESLAATAALSIPVDVHDNVIKKVLSNDPAVTESTDFIKIKNLLKKIQTTNRLSSDVYTYISLDQDHSKMTFIAMSSDVPYTGNQNSLHPTGAATLKNGVSGHTGIHRDEEGQWISAFAPIHSSTGDVVAALELDYRVDVEFFEARKLLLLRLGFTSLVIILVSFGLGRFLGKSLSDELKAISTVLMNSAEDAVGNGDLLSLTSQDLSNAAEVSATSIQKTVNAIGGLSKAVSLSAQSAIEASDLSNQSASSAYEGVAEINQLNKAMNEIASGSEKMKTTLAVIDDIFFQINILSLNASIEASRAGEQGKGFAVIAEAVRDLAQRSAVSAQEISKTVQENVLKVEVGNKIADRSQTALQTILENIQKVQQKNQEIAIASENQTVQIAEIAAAMNQLESTTEANLQASKKVAQYSDSMVTSAGSLLNMTEKLSGAISG